MGSYRMFAGIYSNYRLGAAAAVVQNLLERHDHGGPLGRNTAGIAARLVARVYNNDPALFDGKRGKRPHKLSLAAVALAQGVEDMREDRDGQLSCQLSLGTVLLEITGKPQKYALSGNDHMLLSLAQEVYLAAAA
jgi:hypothetical protein